MNNKMRKCDFSRLAPVYDLLGELAFAGALRRSQTCFTGELPACRRVLIIGGGTGGFLIELLKTKEVDVVDYVDISPGMIKKAREKLQKKCPQFVCKVNFICGSVEEVQGQKYDLICTHYFLDCFSPQELPAIMAGLYLSLNTGGQWLFADFTGDTFLKKNLVAFLYKFFKLTAALNAGELADFRGEFSKLGVQLCREGFFAGRLLRAALYKKNE